MSDGWGDAALWNAVLAEPTSGCCGCCLAWGPNFMTRRPEAAAAWLEAAGWPCVGTSPLPCGTKTGADAERLEEAEKAAAWDARALGSG